MKQSEVDLLLHYIPVEQVLLFSQKSIGTCLGISLELQIIRMIRTVRKIIIRPNVFHVNREALLEKTTLGEDMCFPLHLSRKSDVKTRQGKDVTGHGIHEGREGYCYQQIKGLLCHTSTTQSSLKPLEQETDPGHKHGSPSSNCLLH
jgi:hypothetical protein